jgi:hypothetical protein
MGWRRQRLGLLALLVTTMVAVTSMATMRNWIVAHRFVAISSEGPVVLSVGNSPPPLTIPPSHKALYDRIGLDPLVQVVVEYARQQPRAFGRGLWQKAQYTLGWFEAIRPDAGTSTFYLVTWMTALVGVALLPWVAPRRSLVAAVIPLLVAVSHFAVVVVFQPHVYGDRLIMPFYMLLVPYAAVPVIAAARLAARFGLQRAAAGCWMAFCLVLIGRAIGIFAAVDLDVLAVATLAGGLCLAGVPELRPFRVVIYSGYAAVLAAWLVRDTTAPRGATCRAEWLFLAVALFSGALLPDGAMRRPASWARMTRARRTLTFVTAAALTMGALQAIGTGVNPERALLAGRIAAFGLAGAVVYAIVWIEGAWPTGDTVTALATQGMVLGFFIEVLLGAELADAGGALLLLAGLTIGASGVRRSTSPAI